MPNNWTNDREYFVSFTRDYLNIRVEEMRDSLEEAENRVRQRAQERDQAIRERRLCGRCGNVAESRDDMVVLTFNRRICQSCHQRYEYCNDCGSTYLRDDGECANCVQTYVRRYNYRPNPKWLKGSGQRRAVLYFGVEFEVECEDRISLCKTIDQYPWLYVKHDGSLEHGVELVTHPFTWEWYKENRKEFQDLLRKVRESGGTVRDTCGLHFHLSKEAFNRLHLYKLMSMVYSNRATMLSISGRTRNGWVNRYCRFNNSDGQIKWKARHKNRMDGEEKYQAVNLTNETVEIRFFSGTLDPEVFHERLRFIRELYRFTRDRSLRDLIVGDLLEGFNGEVLSGYPTDS